MVEFSCKPFYELSTQEVYEILKLRSEIFVVEQNCIYQDIDNKDAKALHIIGLDQNQVFAYARIFAPGDYFKNSSIGRIAVAKSHRAQGLGRELLQFCLNTIIAQYGPVPITISAQKYLESFYGSLGFKGEGNPYLEDGIPHLQMTKV